MRNTGSSVSSNTENGRLKKLLAERDLAIELMKEIAAKKL